MDHIPEPSGKSLLLQTVALFETLLSKIQSMKKENETTAAENLRLNTSLELKCSVEDNLKTVEGKLQSANEVKTMAIKPEISNIFSFRSFKKHCKNCFPRTGNLRSLNLMLRRRKQQISKFLTDSFQLKMI